jgi:hypothetical protein
LILKEGLAGYIFTLIYKVNNFVDAPIIANTVTGKEIFMPPTCNDDY